MSKKTVPKDISEVEDYEDEEEAVASLMPTTTAKSKDNYASHHSSGFREMLLKPELLQTISEAGFEHPSEVQAECLPQAIVGTDVICQAKSGMGKTAVFVLTILHRLSETPAEESPKALVLCHTRELAFQITAEFQRLGKRISEAKVAAIYGGVPIAQQRKLLSSENPSIVVGTPGRVKELVLEKKLNLSKITMFALDECDQLLSRLDMRKDVQQIFLKCPRSKQVMMFSATINPSIRDVCKKFTLNPIEITISDTKIFLHGLTQYYKEVTEDAKNQALIEILDSVEFRHCIVFVKSPLRATALAKLLKELNFPADCVHSNMKPQDRMTKYQALAQSHSVQVIVATNLFGRGVDLERVNVVINYDFPESSDTYLHRVGRAGRFGSKGLCISFVSSPKDHELLQEVHTRFTVEVAPLPAVKTLDNAHMSS